MRCSAMQRNTVQSRANILFSAVQCSAVQCSAVNISAVQCTTIKGQFFLQKLARILSRRATAAGGGFVHNHPVKFYKYRVNGLKLPSPGNIFRGIPIYIDVENDIISLLIDTDIDMDTDISMLSNVIKLKLILCQSEMVRNNMYVVSGKQ